jgi:hypothetical protein
MEGRREGRTRGTIWVGWASIWVRLPTVWTKIRAVNPDFPEVQLDLLLEDFDEMTLRNDEDAEEHA